MNTFEFVLTEDNSVGLYNNIVKDIYHSKTGALTEAVDKFINPLNLINKKYEVNILDICYGIGYNTKAILYYSNENMKINIDALEYDKDLVLISPFIKDEINDVNLKLELLNNILKSSISLSEISKLIIKTIENTSITFFDENLVYFINFLIKEGYQNNPLLVNNSFLHNIYYNYISSNNNSNKIPNKYEGFIINYYFNDARKSIKSLSNKYDYVFLDAFSPQKDPTLWTIDFLNEIKQKMNDDSILVSYSKSTPFRSALYKLGFHVGKTILNNFDMGTVASLNKNNILNPLSNYDIELLNTRSGIPYRDVSFYSTPDEILKRREIEQINSNLISHTAFLKKYSK